MKTVTSYTATAVALCLWALLAVTLACGAFAKGSVRDEGIRAKLPQAAYAGSHACRSCHETRYAQWAKSPKARFVRLRSELELLPGDWTNAPVDADEVAVVVGFRRKVAFVDAEWQIMPFEYRLDKATWKPRPTWRDRDYRERCGTCHLTGLNVRTLLFHELGVGCESCHGPGALHVRNESGADIRVPVAVEGMTPAVCRRCHNERNNHSKPLATWTGLYHR